MANLEKTQSTASYNKYLKSPQTMGEVYFASWQLAHDSINVDLAIEVGSESMIKFENSLTEVFDEKIS